MSTWSSTWPWPTRPPRASELANLPAEIDNGTTKSYVMAYVFSQPTPSAS